jgi:hypothetical protein
MRSEAQVARIVKRALHAKAQDYGLVLSPQRTGSKYLVWTLRALWGARSNLDPENSGPLSYRFVGHSHGLTDSRALAAMPGRDLPHEAVLDGLDKVHALLLIRQRLATVRWSAVFTIVRDPEEQALSRFCLQKRALMNASDDELRQELPRLQAYKAEARDWYRENIEQQFAAPALPKLRDWSVYSDGPRNIVAIRLEALDAFLEAHVFPHMSRAEIAARAERHRLWREGVARNSVDELGLRAFHDRVRGILKDVRERRAAS